MFEGARKFTRTTLLGGIIVILPTIILIFAFKWLFGVVAGAIRPLTDLVVVDLTVPEGYKEAIAIVIVLSVIIMTCFLVGLLVRTRLGQWIFNGLERAVLSRAPGYRMVKETVNHFLGSRKSPFSSVALVDLFGNGTLVTSFITDRHDNGLVTVFVPTGPNPTSGFIYHLEEKYVHPVNVPVEEAMRSVISCGAGSDKLIAGLRQEAPPSGGAHSV